MDTSDAAIAARINLIFGQSLEFDWDEEMKTVNKGVCDLRLDVSQPEQFKDRDDHDEEYALSDTLLGGQPQLSGSRAEKKHQESQAMPEVFCHARSQKTDTFSEIGHVDYTTQGRHHRDKEVAREIAAQNEEGSSSDSSVEQDRKAITTAMVHLKNPQAVSPGKAGTEDFGLNGQDHTEEDNYYAESRAINQAKRIESAAQPWSHPATRTKGNANGSNHGRLNNGNKSDAPIRKGRGFSKPSGIKKDRKKAVKNNKAKKLQKATEIGLAVINAVKSAQGALTKNGAVSVTVTITTESKMCKSKARKAGKAILQPKKGNRVKKRTTTSRPKGKHVAVPSESGELPKGKPKRRARRKNEGKKGSLEV